jgi:hypothetical protein
VVQGEGGRIRTEEGDLVASVFELGELPPEGAPAPELVVVEADGTLHPTSPPNGKRGTASRSRPGCSTPARTGPEEAGTAGGSSSTNGCYATTGDADAFGKALAARGFAWVGLHRARWVLAVHDGLDEYGQGFRDWFPRAHHQIDHFHVAERLWEVSGADRDLFEALRDLAFSDPRACARKLRRSLRVRRDLASEVASYLERVARDLYGADRLPRHLRRGRMRVVGSGVVEKH